MLLGLRCLRKVIRFCAEWVGGMEGRGEEQPGDHDALGELYGGGAPAPAPTSTGSANGFGNGADCGVCVPPGRGGPLGGRYAYCACACTSGGGPAGGAYPSCGCIGGGDWLYICCGCCCCGWESGGGMRRTPGLAAPTPAPAPLFVSAALRCSSATTATRYLPFASRHARAHRPRKNAKRGSVP